MIIALKKLPEQQSLQNLCDRLKAIYVAYDNKHLLVTPSKTKEIPEDIMPLVDRHWIFPDDMQLASRQFMPEKRTINISGEITIGGNTNHCLVIGGPCSVESEEQIEASASFMKSLGISVLRAGSYKPRTSPYSFQGLGKQGLILLDKMRSKYGLKIITEVRDATHIEDIIEYADIIQIGAKSMYDHGILKRCGKTNKPVLLKRGFGSTLQEFVQAAEFILSGGNPNVILCERGIRTFETKTRFTLDLCGAAYLKHHTNLPIILDPSHAIGHAYGVPDLAKACLAMGIDGLLIEVHPNPKVALSDASQQLDHDKFARLYEDLKKLANALNIKII